jgi:hypothetical protein
VVYGSLKVPHSGLMSLDNNVFFLVYLLYQW